MIRALIILWTLPTTSVGLVFLPLAWLGRGSVRRVDGVLELQGPWIAWCLEHLVPLDGGASAMTLGEVVIARDQTALDLTRTHERVHVAQARRWGPLFIPAYFLASAWIKLRGGDAYRDNPFEREAYGGPFGCNGN